MSDDLLQSPYLLLGALSTYIPDRGGTFTLQECYSRLGVESPEGGAGAAEATINILLCAGEAPGAYLGSIDYVTPDGTTRRMPPAPVTFEQPYDQQMINVDVSVLPVPGRHFYDFRLNGRLVVRLPLEVEVREKMPPLGKMRPYPDRVTRN